MAILNQLQNDLKQALKDSEESLRDTVRLILAQIKNRAIELGENLVDLSEEEVIKVLRREIKKRKESIAAYEKASRLELAEKEKKELSILEKYAPPMMSDSDLEKLVADTVAELGGKEAVNFGQVMQVVMQKTSGQADGKKVSELVKKALN